MSSIINALSDLVTSVVEVIWSFFTTALHLVENTAQFVVKFASEILQLVINFFKGLVDLAGGLASFVVGKSSYILIMGEVQGLTRNRKCHHARRSSSPVLRVLAVPA